MGFVHEIHSKKTIFGFSIWNLKEVFLSTSIQAVENSTAASSRDHESYPIAEFSPQFASFKH